MARFLLNHEISPFEIRRQVFTECIRRREEKTIRDLSLDEVNMASNYHAASAQPHEQPAYPQEKVFKAFSKINGAINRMPVEQIQQKLLEARLDSTGSDLSVRKRLKNHVRSEAASRFLNQKIDYKYDAIIVIDFEATCERDSSPPIIQEIIEFPAFLIDVNRKVVVSSFATYVKPTVNPTLSEFCTELTGIKQDMVDNAHTFPDVLNAFEDWLYTCIRDHQIESFAFASDGYV